VSSGRSSQVRTLFNKIRACLKLPLGEGNWARSPCLEENFTIRPAQRGTGERLGVRAAWPLLKGVDFVKMRAAWPLLKGVDFIKILAWNLCETYAETYGN